MIVLKHTMLLIFFLLISATANAQHWQSSDGPVPLLIDSNLVRIKLQGELTDQALQALVDSQEKLVWVVKEIEPYEGFAVCSLSTKENYALTIDDLSKSDAVYMAEPFYRKKNGDPHMFGFSFVVVFEDEPIEAVIEDLAFDNSVELGRQVGHKTWVFHNIPGSGYNIVDISNLFHDFKEVKAALPDFEVRLKQDSYDLYDYYNDFQYHIKRVIGDFNSNSVWDFAGLTNTVRVAVIDDGITAHEDLPSSRILQGYDYFHNDSDPSPGRHRGHGMSVAGIIGASHSTDTAAANLDSTGIISMNPIVEFIPIKIFADTLNQSIPHSQIDEAFHDAILGNPAADTLEADIIVACWHIDEDSTIPLPDLDDEIDYGFSDGRLWRGTPYVRHGTPIFFSAGNDSTRVAYPARHDSAFAVGAIDTFDNLQSYSNYGSELDLVTYSADYPGEDFWSIDQMDTLGSNPHHQFLRSPNDIPPSDCGFSGNDVDYDCAFGGTSAAAPVVAGVAALLLSRNDTLSAATIYDILRNSAVTELQSDTITPPDTLYGYGRVDAYRAMLSIVRGDVNNDAVIDTLDVNYLIDKVYYSGPDPQPDRRVGNCNCDPEDRINLADITKLIGVVYLGDTLSIPCYVY